MHNNQTSLLITGTRKGLGRYMAEYYLRRGFTVFGCSRSQSDLTHENYFHFCVDVNDESAVAKMLSDIKDSGTLLHAVINNAGIASMNHALLTPKSTVEKLFQTNVFGLFLICRESAKIMQKQKFGRIVNLTTVATPLKLEGEAVYASSKAAVISLTEILAREFSPYGITVNAIGPTPVDTDLIRNVPKEKIDQILMRQAVRRMGKPSDVLNVVDFFIRPESDFITGQTIFLGGI